MRVDAILHAGDGGAGVVVDGDVAVSKVAGVATHADTAAPLKTVAAILAPSLTITVPLTSIFAAAALPPRYPADTPEAPRRCSLHPPKIDGAERIHRYKRIAPGSDPCRLIYRVDTATSLIYNIVPGGDDGNFPGPHAAAPMP